MPRLCWLALQVGAAVLGVPVKPTIKEVDGGRMVVKTLKRAALWEVQTPQVKGGEGGGRGVGGGCLLQAVLGCHDAALA